MENKVICSIRNGNRYVYENLATFLSDGENAVFFIPDIKFDCVNYVDKNYDYIKKAKKLNNILYLLPKELIGYNIKNDKVKYLSIQEIHDLRSLSLQSSIADNFYLLSFEDVFGRVFIPDMTFERVIMNGVLGIPMMQIR